MIASVGEKFPYPTFPYRLEFKENKDKKICWFECQEHVDTHIKRYKLKKKDYTLIIKNND